ncbi:hypothetical protein [Methyloceanibacter sp. wino2]|uniref:hypothetical protein n=1 Tax=Methyloceanibacter sp. wino2 TaxID=2170729 RepID=UPI000D3E1A6E|nr:hypothetical protein [Methyloceanibacter sp. wino2]
MSKLHPKRAPKDAHPEYRPEFAHQALKLSQLGLSEEDLAYFFEVEPRTVAGWMREQPEFRSAVEIGSLDCVSTVERETVRNICGYFATKERLTKGKVVTLRYWVPGDPDAGMKWLARRAPDRLQPS